MKKISEITKLIDIYGVLLSQKKLEYINYYYFNDLSLKEIADNHNISRSAVHQSIIDGVKELYDYEKKLKIIKCQNLRLDLIEKEIKDESVKKKFLKLEIMYNK